LTELEKARLDSSLMIRPSNVQRFAHYGYVYCMLLVHEGDWDTKQGDTLISGGGDGIIKLWSLDGQDDGRPKEIGTLDDGRESGEPVLSLALDGTFLYGARVDGMINVWDLDTRQLLRTIDTTVREDVLTLSVGRGVVYAGLVDGSIMVRGGSRLAAKHHSRACRLSIKDTTSCRDGGLTMAESSPLVL
jgi:di- and tripeptidase